MVGGPCTNKKTEEKITGRCRLIQTCKDAQAL